MGREWTTHHYEAELWSCSSTLCNVCMCFFVLIDGGRGGGLEYGLHNRAERCNHRMSQGKNLFHTNSVFLQSQNCIMNRKIF